MEKISFLMSLSLLVPALVPAWGSTWYVDGSVSASGDGTTWATAFKKIQEGVDAASHGDTVIVAQRTYVENILFKSSNIVLTGTDPLDPNVVANTVIDGNKAGSVVTFSGTEAETCVLSGFTIRNGSLIQGSQWAHGGGICGGREGSGPARATVENNIIAGNSAGGAGGGIYFCSGTIRNNFITGNSAGGYGGGLEDCNGTIEDNVISNNSGYGGGGIGFCHGTVQNNIVRQNSALLIGGGLTHCDGFILNNLICGNSSSSQGGGLLDCHGTIENNTIVNNSATKCGGGIQCDATIHNCIIWGNTAKEDPQVWAPRAPTHSCIQGWTAGGEGNMSDDPQFVDPDGPDDNPETYEDNDYRLRADSPCIDAGKNEDWMWGALDLDGNNRVFFGSHSKAVDMGAYEYGSFPFKIVGVGKRAPGGAELTWTSRPGDGYIVWSFADLLTGTWVEEASVTSQGASTSWTDAFTLGQQKFYRIEMK